MAMANPDPDPLVLTAQAFDAVRTKIIGPLAGPALILQILKEMAIADSVHDFNQQFYDRIAFNRSINGYHYNANLFSTINFTYACQFIFAGNTDDDKAKRLFAEINNKVQAGQLGVLTAEYTKSSSADRDNIEKYYLKKAIQLTFGLGANYPKLDGNNDIGAGYTYIPKKVGGVDLTQRQTYDQLVGALANYAQFEEDPQTPGFPIKYIPLVVDVQKRLTNVLRRAGTNYVYRVPNPLVPGTGTDVKLAYCLNREMTNDAAGKLNFREPQKIAGINYFVDIDEREVRYREVDGIIIGTGRHISFSRLQNINFPGLADVPPAGPVPAGVVPLGVPLGKRSQALSPWCTISLLPNPNQMGLPVTLGNFLSILNDSSGNSKTNVRQNVHRNARTNLATLIGIQNANTASGFSDAVNAYLENSVAFRDNYRSQLVQHIFDLKNSNGVLQGIALQIYIWFLRKRLGDQLQALSCKKCRKYTRISYNAQRQLVHNLRAGGLPFEQDKQSVFYSYDAIACAFAILNKIPCIYEDARKNLHVFVPQDDPGCLAAADPGTIIGGGKFNDKNNVNQSGGLRWNLIPNVDQYLLNAILAKPETIINIAGRIFTLYPKYDKREIPWTMLYQECQVNIDNFTTYTFNRTREQMMGAGEPGGEIINVFYLSPNVSGIPADVSAREYEGKPNSPMCVIVDIRTPLPDGSPGHFIVSYDFRTGAFEIKGPTAYMTAKPEAISISQIQGSLEGVLTKQSLDFTIFELVNNQLEPELQAEAGDMMDEDIFASMFERYINTQDGGGKKDSESVGEKLTTNEKIESTYLLDFITMSLKNKKISSTTDKAFYFFNRFLFLKLLYTYEFQLIFDEERYEIDYNTSVLPNIAENQELYCLLEISKAFNDKINFIELLIYLNMLRGNSLDPTDFVVNVLVNLAEIFDFTLETTDYKLLELLALNEKLEISTDKKEIFKQILEESKTLFENEKNDRLFDAFYFNNLYNEECNEFLKKHGKKQSKTDEVSELGGKILREGKDLLQKGKSLLDVDKDINLKRSKSLPENLKPPPMPIHAHVARVAGGSSKKKTRRKKGRTTRKKRKSIKKKRKLTRRKRRSSRKKNKLSRKKK